jgi:heme o synthase
MKPPYASQPAANAACTQSSAISVTIASTISAYLLLTKPSIMLLVLFTGAAALVVQGSLLARPVDFALVLLGLFLAGGSANALNQYFERDIDSNMTRTRKRRPLPMGTLSPGHALLFAIVIGTVGVAIFAVRFNWLTAGLALFTIVFYSFYYTLWLKPRTTNNIVIGGIAGAMAPVGAWAAATGEMAIAPLVMFLIVFLWTPPHFWSLALFCSDDYRRVKLPMLPIVNGEQATLNQIFWYTLVLVTCSLSLAVLGSGWLYLLVALWMGSTYLRMAWRARRDHQVSAARGLFKFSLVYLFVIFAAIMVDALIPAAPFLPPLPHLG